MTSPGDLKKILELCEKHNVALYEDGPLKIVFNGAIPEDDDRPTVPIETPQEEIIKRGTGPYDPAVFHDGIVPEFTKPA